MWMVALWTVAVVMCQVGASPGGELRVLDCTLQSTGLDSCDALRYAIRAGVCSLSGVIVAVLLLLLFPLYCGGKYCCNCCGGREQSPNFCCPDTRHPTVYTRADIVRPKLLAVLALVGAVVGLVFGLRGAVEAQDGVSGIITVVSEVPEVLTQQITEVRDALMVPRFNVATNTTTTVDLFETSGALESANRVKDALQAGVDRVLSAVSTHVRTAVLAIFALLSVPVLAMLIGAVPVVTNSRRFLPMGVLWSLFLFGFLVWVSNTLFSLVHVVSDDLCTEVHAFTRQQGNVIAAAVECTDDTVRAFRDEVNVLIATEATTACESLLEKCYNTSKTQEENLAELRVFDCVQSVSCTDVSVAELDRLVRSDDVRVSTEVTGNMTLARNGLWCTGGDSAAECTIEQCSRECVLSNWSLSSLGVLSFAVVSNVEVATIVSRAVTTVAFQLATCDTVLGLIITPFDAPCFKTPRGFGNLEVGTTIEGVSLLVFMLAMVWGAKRFLPLREAKRPQGGPQGKSGATRGA